VLWWDTTSEFGGSPDAARKLMSDELTDFDGGGLFNSVYVSAENAPGLLAAELAETSYDVIVFDATKSGTGSFNQADLDELAAFYETRMNVLLDGVLWIRSLFDFNETTQYPGINGSTGGFTANEVFQLASRGGGVMIGTDHNCCQAEANQLIAAMIPGAAFSGSTTPSLDGQFNGDDLLNAVAVVSASDLLAHWSTIPSEAIAPTGDFTDVFGDPVTLYSQVDVADIVGGPQFSYISTSFEPGGNVVEFDCNNNDILDSIDIAEGTSLDVNENGIPDECEGTVVHGPFELSDWPEAIQLNDGQDSAYIALQESGLDIHDVFDRDNASWLSNFDASSDCSPGQFFADEVALIEEDGQVDAIISGGECGVVGADVTNSSNPVFIDSIPIPFGLAEETAVMDAADGENLLLYVASFWQGLQIFEIVGECTGNCVVEQRGSIGAVDEWGASLAVWIETIYSEEAPPQLLAYVASTEGLQIVDVTDPDAPALLGRLDTNPTDIPLKDLDDVPQDVVVSGGLAFVPIWIGGFLVIDVTDPANPVLSQPVIPASPNTAFFKVEVSSRDNRIYVTEGISGLASFIQRPSGELVLEERFPIGVDDDRCTFDEGGVSDVCWAWAIDEVGELVSVTYGVLDSPQAGGFQLISMPRRSVQGVLLKTLKATPIPEPHLLILQGVGVLAVAGLGRLRRKRRERSTQG
jgi:hypothetical protein